MPRKKKEKKETKVEEQAEFQEVIFVGQPETPPAPPPPEPLPAPPPSMDVIKEDASKWAEESGLKPPFVVSGPERVEYGPTGHGFMVRVQEENAPRPDARCRQGTATYTSAGVRSMWTIDGIPMG